MIKLAFFSNYFNAHQLPLARELFSMKGVDFIFVSLLKTEGSVGRNSLDNDYPFVLREYENDCNATLAMKLAVEADIAIFGDMAGKEQYVRARYKTGRLFFRYSERLLRRGDYWRFIPPKIYRTWNRFTRYKTSEMYVLCSSAYTARDLSLFGFPRCKCLKWGYFPEIHSIDDRDVVKRENVICSVQRLIPLKRVEMQIEALSSLTESGFDMSLHIAGDGPERAALEARARDLGIADRVVFLGELDGAGVATLLSSSRYFVATSNKKEGWGATINEAMASGCSVIACSEMGSVPYLIQDGINGFTFSGGTGEFVSKLKMAVSLPLEAAAMGKRAQVTMCTTWSASVAAKNLVRFGQSVLAGKADIPEDGPVSLA